MSQDVYIACQEKRCNVVNVALSSMEEKRCKVDERTKSLYFCRRENC